MKSSAYHETVVMKKIEKPSERVHVSHSTTATNFSKSKTSWRNRVGNVGIQEVVCEVGIENDNGIVFSPLVNFSNEAEEFLDTTV